MHPTPTLRSSKAPAEVEAVRSYENWFAISDCQSAPHRARTINIDQSITPYGLDSLIGGELLHDIKDKSGAGQLAMWSLFTDRARPPVQIPDGATQSLASPRNWPGVSSPLSLENNANLYMTLLTAIEVLLFRYTGQQDLYVGSPTL